MGFFDFIANAAGGGVVGSLLHLVTSAFEVWKKKKDAEVEILLLQAKMQAAEKEAAWNAFTKSHENDSGGSQTLPENTHPVMVNLHVGVDAFRNFTRPGLTWALLLVVVYIFNVSPQDAQAQMLDEITFGSFTALFWWFGSRYARR